MPPSGRHGRCAATWTTRPVSRSTVQTPRGSGSNHSTSSKALSSLMMNSSLDGAAHEQGLLSHVVAKADQLARRGAQHDARVEPVQLVDDARAEALEERQHDVRVAGGRLQAVRGSQRAVVVDLAVDGPDQVPVLIWLDRPVAPAPLIARRTNPSTIWPSIHTCWSSGPR
jgi:hypothetical protein